LFSVSSSLTVRKKEAAVISLCLSLPNGLSTPLVVRQRCEQSSSLARCLFNNFPPRFHCLNLLLWFKSCRCIPDGRRVWLLAPHFSPHLGALFPSPGSLSSPQLIQRLGPPLCLPLYPLSPALLHSKLKGGRGKRGGQDLVELLLCNHVKLRMPLFALGALVLSYSCYLAAAHSWARREWSPPALPATNPAILSTARGFRAAAFAHWRVFTRQLLAAPQP